MSQHTFGARPSRSSVPFLSPLGMLLQVRLLFRPEQRLLFCGAEDFTVQALTSELAYTISRLRVGSFGLRRQLEAVTCALQDNVSRGLWKLACRAALDLAALLVQAKKRGVSSPGLCIRCANTALRIAELCGKEGR